MQFQMSTDYAVRILSYLHLHKDELSTANGISKAVGVTYPFFIKIANRLKNEGLLEAVQGRKGGYKLARSAAEISLYDVVMAMEGKLQINRCLKDDKFCSRGDPGDCPVHDFMQDLQGKIIADLSRVHIAELSTAS